MASTMEGQDTETVMKLYDLSRDNLYQIRKRLTAKLRETVAEALRALSLPETVRGEALTLAQFAALSDQLGKT